LNAMHRFALALIMVVVCLANGWAEDWPGFRGVRGTGVSTEKNLPVQWSTKDNIAWKTKLPGPGSSSPIVVGDKVFVTCYTGLPDETLVRHLLCLDRAKGTVLWQKDLRAKVPEFPYKGYMTEHGYASSTPVSDGTNVYVFFGKSGVYAFDLKGNALWQKDVGEKTHMWGSASSPVLYKDLLIVNADIESGSLIAFNKKSGSEVWRKPIGDNSWSTPILVDVPGGKTELVVSMPDVVKGIDPETGDTLWQCKGIPKFSTSSPVAQGGVVYVTGGGGPFPAVGFAIRAGGRGDVGKTHEVWNKGIGTGISSAAVAGKYLFAMDQGKLACFSVDKGQLVTAKTADLKGMQYGSPVVADGKLYYVTRNGTTYVFGADDKMQPLGENHVEEEDARFDAGVVVAEGQLLVRSTGYLYCIGKK
jgi:outer membrane protein assembly factor BamB